MPIQRGSIIFMHNFKNPGNGQHHYFVITNPDCEGNVLLVNLTEHEAGVDESCVFERGHCLSSKLTTKKKSVVKYDSYGRLFRPLEKVQQAVDANLVEDYGVLGCKDLKSVIDGGLASDHLPEDFKEILRKDTNN